MQSLFKLVTFSLTTVLSYLIYIDYLVYHDLQKQKPSSVTDLPQFRYIFWVPFMSAFAIFALKRQIQNISRPLFLRITKDQEDKEVWLARIDRSSSYIFKFTFYLISSFWAIWLFQGSDCLPSWMGGIGSVKNQFKDFPFKKQIPGLLWYSLIQLGYFIEDFYQHVFVKPRTNDFWEMNFHHFLTITLFGGMIATNTIALGSFVSFLHNLSDILMTLSRILSNTVFKTQTYLCFGLAIISWIITRNIMLPVVCYECWLGHIYPEGLSQFQGGLNVLNTFLSLLCVLHIYWTWLFIKMLINAIKKGDSDDAQRKLVVVKQQKAS